MKFYVDMKCNADMKCYIETKGCVVLRAGWLPRHCNNCLMEPHSQQGVSGRRKDNGGEIWKDNQFEIVRRPAWVRLKERKKGMRKGLVDKTPDWLTDWQREDTGRSLQRLELTRLGNYDKYMGEAERKKEANTNQQRGTVSCRKLDGSRARRFSSWQTNAVGAGEGVMWAWLPAAAICLAGWCGTRLSGKHRAGSLSYIMYDPNAHMQ